MSPPKRHCLSAELITIVIISIFSIVSFGLGAEYARQAAKSPIDLDGPFATSVDANPTTSRIIFYSTTMPFLSTLYSLFHLSILYWRPSASILGPIPALIASIFLFCGWITQVGMWSSCEINIESSVGVCFQEKLVVYLNGGMPKFLDNRIHTALLSVGFVAMAASIALIGVLGIGLFKARRAGKNGRDEDEIGLKEYRSIGSV
ncbi:MAG: hypothetical protein Q9160_004625 [Pyrenula sp. 1 TL-2023]